MGKSHWSLVNSKPLRNACWNLGFVFWDFNQLFLDTETFRQNKMNKNCPCGSNKLANEYCVPIILGIKAATTAEELMRSRYVAYTSANVDYLMRSHHSTTRPTKDRKSIERWAKSVQWMGLVILSTEAGLENDQRGMVEFRALYLENGELQQIHEKSLFEREKGKWVYVSGVHY